MEASRGRAGYAHDARHLRPELFVARQMAARRVVPPMQSQRVVSGVCMAYVPTWLRARYMVTGGGGPQTAGAYAYGGRLR